MMSDIKTLPAFVLRDYWIEGKISSEEYNSETSRRYTESQNGKAALAILQKMLNNPAFMLCHFGEERPRIEIKFDDNASAWNFIHGLSDARALIEAATTTD